jgi:hypothetical protein
MTLDDTESSNDQKVMKRLILLHFFNNQQLPALIPRVWLSPVGVLLVFRLYTPCYVRNDKKGIISAAGKTGQDIMWQIKWFRSLHEVGRYTKVHISYNIVLPIKVQYPVALWF